MASSAAAVGHRDSADCHDLTDVSHIVEQSLDCGTLRAHASRGTLRTGLIPLFTPCRAFARLPLMQFLDTWRVGFELELILGDLGDPRFEYHARDPMDVASHEYCRAVAIKLSEYTGKRWLAAQKKQHRTGYFVYPEYDLDPLHWPYGLVAGVELVTPPLRMAEAETLRTQIRNWVESVDGDINTYHNHYASNSGWHINIDPGCEHREINESTMLLTADELPVLLSALRYPSKYAAPQRHAYGVPLLRYARSDASRGLLNVALENFLLSYGGRGKGYAMNLDKLGQGYLELRHFGSEWFFRDESLEVIIAPFLAAAEASQGSYRARERNVRQTFDILAKWTDQLAPTLRCEWQPQSSFVVDRAFGQVYFENDVLADVTWSGSASYSIRVAGGHEGPTIASQPFPDIALSIAVLALDIAEIRARKLGKIRVSNKAFSQAIDKLSRSLKRAGLSEAPPLEKSEFWQSPADQQPINDRLLSGDLI